MSKFCGKVISVEEIEKEPKDEKGVMRCTHYVVEDQFGNNQEFTHPGEMSDELKKRFEEAWKNQKININVETKKVKSGKTTIYKVTRVKLTTKKCP